MLLRCATLGLVLGGLVGQSFAAGHQLQTGAARETLVAAAGGDPAERISDVGRTDVPPGAVDLTKDADGDGLPDELEAGVDAALAIASGGNPNELDDNEVEPFTSAIMDLADRLPLSAQTRENQRDILDLTAKLEDASPRKARRIFRRIGKEERDLRKDRNLKVVMESLDRMLGPATADAVTTAGVAAALVTPRRPPPTRKPAFERLERGDVMLLRSKIALLYPWVWYYSHAGTYDGNNMVYESLGNGVQLGPLQHWKERGTRVALGRSIKSSQAQVVAALDKAKSRYGTDRQTPYNFFFPDKLRDDKIYCSQLTWKIHKSLGVDMDSNDPRWFLQMGLKNFYAPLSGQYTSLVTGVLIPAVAPDEVFYSRNVDFYSEGDN